MKNSMLPGIIHIFFFCIFILLSLHSQAQIVPVGSGSYTTTFPGTDAAGRNSFPSGTPQLTGNALGKPVPTNDWWSKLIMENHADNLFNYPFTLKTTNQGLVVSYIPWGVISDINPVIVGVTGMATTKTTVSDYSDWTVSMNWNDGTRQFEATAGIAMPFLYFTKKDTDIAQVTVNSGTVTIADEMLVVVNAINGADFAVYAPTGSTWIKNGNIYTSTLNGKNYWSLAFIPLTATNVSTVANEYKKYAYVFPKNTTSSWNYNESTSVLRTDFEVITDVKEGSETEMLMGLLPHQWANLAGNSPVPDKYSYSSVRGEIKTMAGNSFSTENTFYGILPTLPNLNHYSNGFSHALLNEKIESIQNNGLDLWTDSYNEGQLMNRLIQTARIAHETGNIAARNKLLATIKERLEDWLTAESGEKAFLFYYNATWSAIIGYPAGHGQDSNLNDHHFHWGYFIHAAAFLEQFEPGWAAQWGDMVNMLVRDAAGTDRNDPLFPYLRNYSPYAGHCWANGFATFPQGNDQESTSESMQFNSSLIHWGTITGNKEIRDLGIYLYTTEQTAIEEYWFDMYERNFGPLQQYSLVSRVWGNSYDNGTFWTSDIAASYGIELYPIHGGSLYLGHNHAYVSKLWNEIKANTGISNNEANVNLWHDIMWQYQAFIDPEGAIALYDSYPERALKFGVSDAQTYYWLHSMNALGRVDTTITADYPISAAFTRDDKTIYVAHNYSNSPITVNFSTGYKLDVPAAAMKTSEDISISGVLTSTFNQAYINGSVGLSLIPSDGVPTKVEFIRGTTVLGSVENEPYTWEATQLPPGKHNFYARIYQDDKFNTSNIVQVIVGSQLPYNGEPWPIPGALEAGKYDVFEGGNGQNVSYLDMSPGNEGGFRPEEYVDAALSGAEGASVGWISAGEWIEFTVDATESGLYSMAFRYASGNANGGGPFSLEIDGKSITSAITVPSTSTTRWDVWATKTVSDIPLTQGQHVLRISFSSGEFNLGRMTFARTGPMPFSFPLAHAGGNVKVVLPATSAQLNGSLSTESTGQLLTFNWSQIYGPSVVEFSDATIANPEIKGLVEGIYKMKLTVTNPDLRSDSDEIFVIVSASENLAPLVSLIAPANQSTFRAGADVVISATASDFDGTIEKVEFFQNDILIGTDTSRPYSITWSAEAGNYALVAKATDNQGSESTSQAIQIVVVPVQTCSGTSTQASEGSFTDGYNYSFETVGNEVTITFELLDNKSGVVAYLWNKSPFSEKAMTSLGNKKFSLALNGQVQGSKIEVACKFAFAGGLAVTRYLTYTVGEHCSTVGTEFLEETSTTPLIIYPNPASGFIMVELPEPVSEKIQLSIFDLASKRVAEESITSQVSRINTSDLKPGIYFISLIHRNRIYYEKLVVGRR
jgi:endo-1,3(4)-beta-glucanase